MKKNGFTLVELLGIIIVLGILTLVIFPVVNYSTENARQKSYQTQIATIIEAAKKWSVINTDMLPNGNETFSVSLSKLIGEGYIEVDKTGKIINPIDEKEMKGCVVIKYITEYNQYSYEYSENCE